MKKHREKIYFLSYDTFLINYNSNRLTCMTRFYYVLQDRYSTVLTEMERRGRSWLLDENVNCVAVVTPDDQTLRRAVGRRSHPRRLLFFISTPYIIILPAKWLVLLVNLRIFFAFIFFWIPYYFTGVWFPWIPIVLKM